MISLVIIQQDSCEISVVQSSVHGRRFKKKKMSRPFEWTGSHRCDCEVWSWQLSETITFIFSSRGQEKCKRPFLQHDTEQHVESSKKTENMFFYAKTNHFFYWSTNFPWSVNHNITHFILNLCFQSFCKNKRSSFFIFSSNGAYLILQQSSSYWLFLGAKHLWAWLTVPQLCSLTTDNHGPKGDVVTTL